MIGVLHLLFHDGLYPTLLLGHHTEVEFVVHLENHFRTEVFFLKPLVDTNHRHLDDIGGRTLNRRVDGVALGKAPHSGITAVDVGQVAATVEERLHIAFLPCCLLCLFHIFPYLREGFEIAIDEFTRLGTVDFQPFCQSEDGDAIDDAEIGPFGLPALVASHLVDTHLINIGSRCRVNVVALYKRIDHVFVATEVSHYPEFYLTVVGREEEATRFGNERLAYLLAIFATHGNVLEVGVTRRQSSCGGHRLIERRVDMLGFRVDELWQGIDIRTE